MAAGSTVYRVQMELSDVDRGVYESLAFRLACHPSESQERLVARLLAYGLLYEPGLEFGSLSDGDEPALSARDLTGSLVHWVDVGTPGADRIHAASKKAQRVTIVSFRGIDGLTREMTRRKIHRADEIEVLLLPEDLVAKLAARLDRNSQWTLVHTDGELSVMLGEENFSGSVQRVGLPQ